MNKDKIKAAKAAVKVAAKNHATATKGVEKATKEQLVAASKWEKANAELAKLSA